MNRIQGKSRKKQGNKEEYTINAQSPQEKVGKMFQRKQVPRYFERKIHESRKKKETIANNEQKICFLPPCLGVSQIYRLFRCKSNGSLQSQGLTLSKEITQKTRVYSNETKTISPLKKEINDETKRKTSPSLKDQPKLREQVKKQRKQIKELKEKNTILLDQMTQLKHQNSTKHRTIQHLNNKFKKLNLKQERKKFEEKTEQVIKLRRIIAEKDTAIAKLQSLMKLKDKELKQLQSEKEEKDDLEKMFIEMNQNFDEIFNEARQPELQSINNSQMDIDMPSEKVIHSLQEKIRYQEIEISMLKKYKFEMEKYEAQLEKQKLKNKILMNKLRLIPKSKDSKASFEDSLSFQLSKESINHP